MKLSMRVRQKLLLSNGSLVLVIAALSVLTAANLYKIGSSAAAVRMRQREAFHALAFRSYLEVLQESAAETVVTLSPAEADQIDAFKPIFDTLHKQVRDSAATARTLQLAQKVDQLAPRYESDLAPMVKLARDDNLPAAVRKAKLTAALENAEDDQDQLRDLTSQIIEFSTTEAQDSASALHADIARALGMLGVATVLAIAATIALSFAVARQHAKYAQELVVRQEAEERAFELKNVLVRYMSEQVADTVIKGDVDLTSGRRQRVTLMFTDIRNFTRLSEKMVPEAVVELLNSYFSRMVDTVFRFGGTLDKYIGDGMMVVFGAPLEVEDHARRAVLAALAMREELMRLNMELAASGGPQLEFGIGIHTGECVVGNIGCDRRMDYTAIGDTVNTASRIESATKEFGVDILISSATYLEVHDLVRVGTLHDVSLKGKSTRLDLFALEGLRSTERLSVAAEGLS